MRILIAPDKFKGSLTAREVAEAISRGVLAVYPDATIDLCPLSDGGEGFVDSLVSATNGQYATARVTGPLPEMKADARYGFLGGNSAPRTAIIEMAAASGLALLRQDQYDPLATTTFGTGELIAHAIQSGAKQILLGIGGSATIDLGIGAAQACGFTVLLKDGETTSPTEPLCGRDVEHVLMVKHGRGEITNGTPITVACDVTSPLTGPAGAAQVYGPQKGASPETVRYFDEVFDAFVARTGTTPLAQTPGAGAAGGLGFGLLAFFGARLENGFEIVARATQLRDRCQHADLVITGEGRFDASSLHGKVVTRVARIASEDDIPCIAICGDRDRALADNHLRQIAALTDQFSKAEAIANPREHLASLSASILRALR